MELEGQEMSAYTEDNSPHPLDIALGSRIRLRRRELGYSQEQLARQVGITFQQVQKYEHGTNRVSFSRLVEIAQALRCGVMDIVGDLDKSKVSSLFSHHVARLNEPGAAELLEAYAAIQSPKHRRAILNLAKQLAEGKTAQLYDIEEAKAR
jgi:transcriptional regulator with XRE-family HTH domain